VDRVDREAAGLQALGQLVGGLARAREDDHRVEGLDLEDAGQGVELVHPVT
jgi:hypothetical protein